MVRETLYTWLWYFPFYWWGKVDSSRYKPIRTMCFQSSICHLWWQWLECFLLWGNNLTYHFLVWSNIIVFINKRIGAKTSILLIRNRKPRCQEYFWKTILRFYLFVKGVYTNDTFKYYSRKVKLLIINTYKLNFTKVESLWIWWFPQTIIMIFQQLNSNYTAKIILVLSSELISLTRGTQRVKGGSKLYISLKLNMNLA